MVALKLGQLGAFWRRSVLGDAELARAFVDAAYARRGGPTPELSKLYGIYLAEKRRRRPVSEQKTTG